MPDNLTGQNISDTYQRLLQVQGNIVTNGTGSAVTASHAVTSSFAHTALSASYAISASHEIILETSSSRAEVAGTLSGLNASITELNYLDGVVSNVKEAYDTVNYNTSTGVLTFTELDNGTDTVDIGVGTNDSPSFQRLSLTIARNDTPTILLPDLDPDAVGPSGTHLKVEVDASAPGIRIGTTDKPIITFVAQDGQDVSYIGADGEFSANAATATTATTATNAINVDVASDTGNAEHPITFIDDTSPDGGYEPLKANSGITANPSTNGLTLGQIIASGNITASSFIASTNITASGNISASGHIYGNQYKTKGQTLGLYHVLSSTIRLADSSEKTEIYGTNIELKGPVTASTNISASGGVTASGIFLPALGRVKFADDQFITGQNNSLTVDGDDTIKLRAADAVNFVDNSNDVYVSINPTVGHITASANISSSGTVIARNFEYPTTHNTTVGNSTGDIIKWGTATATTAGQIYYYNSSGAWAVADADALSTAKSLLAVATDDNSSKGMLLRGVTTLHTITGTQDEGAPLYLKASADGHTAIDAPSTSGHIVRVIGYCLDTSKRVWFDPDKTWVELS